ncbi:hypothetical protein J6590_078139, partial [Homalodisca vitripennis]
RATPPPRSPISSSLSLRNKPYPGIMKQSEETAGVSHVSVTPRKSKAKSSTTEHSSSKPVFIERTLTCANRAPPESQQQQHLVESIASRHLTDVKDFTHPIQNKHIKVTIANPVQVSAITSKVTPQQPKISI